MARETYIYWKQRFITACNDHDKTGSKKDREERLFCKRMSEVIFARVTKKQKGAK